MKHENLTDFSPITYARTGGVLYLLIIVCGLFSELTVRSSLMVAGDAAMTASNIMENDWLFRAGFVSDLIMLLCDIGLAVIFYALLKPVNHTLALAAAFLRLAMDATLGINLLNHFYALLLLGGDSYLAVFEVDQLQALASLFLHAHSIGYAIGLTFFALHCLVLGYLIFKSGFFPRVMGIMLVFASCSYLFDSGALFLLPGYETENYPFVMLPALIAEVSLCLWLLIKGVNMQGQKQILVNG